MKTAYFGREGGNGRDFNSKPCDCSTSARLLSYSAISQHTYFSVFISYTLVVKLLADAEEFQGREQDHQIPVYEKPPSALRSWRAGKETVGVMPGESPRLGGARAGQRRPGSS